MSAQRRKGTAAESAVVDWLRDHGWPYAERRASNGAKDRGDIAGVPGVVIEVKNTTRADLAAHLDETLTEAGNDNALYGALWHKRRGRGSPGDWFVTVDGHTFTRLLAAALGIEDR